MKTDTYCAIDCHNDTLMKIVDPFSLIPIYDIGEETPFHIDLPKFEKSPVSLAYFASFCEGSETPNESLNKLLAGIHALEYTEKIHASRFKICRSIGEIEEGLKMQQSMAIPTIEGNYALTPSNYQGLLRQFRDLGVRVIAPVWNYSNLICDGTLEQFYPNLPGNNGLTEMGRDFVTCMNDLSLLIDVSHMSEKSFWDVVQMSKHPILASHSGVSAIKPHVRNLTDDQIKAIAEMGGVVNIVYCRSFLGEEPVTVETVVNHIDYVVQLVGDDYVGLGSDFDGAGMPDGIEDISDVSKIIEEMKSRGYTYERLNKILWDNNYRLLKTSFEKNAHHQAMSVQFKEPMNTEKYGEDIVLSCHLNFEEWDISKGRTDSNDAEDSFGLVCLVNGQKVKGTLDEVTQNFTVSFSKYQEDSTLTLRYDVVTLEKMTTSGVRQYATQIISIE